MAYTNFTNCTEQEYLDIIYSQDDINRIRIWFNNVELQDAGEYCESLSGTNRILPNDGNKRFSLDNFVAKEYELVLRDLPANTTIQDQVKISIGTLVDSTNDTYEDVPIGIFNIQDTPTTDQNKVTIKLRDNRVKFDFNYNAQPLIESLGGTATKKQILNDICTKAGVTNTITTFNGEDDEIGIYDNTITATTYVSYILEQAGLIPTIDRLGQLIAIDLTNLKTWTIPLDIVENYEIGKPFTIERIVYESGVIKFQTSSNENLETLYLDSANPYIIEQEQIDTIFDSLEDFTFDSAKTGRILGNPAIDPYDLIEIYDEDNQTTILTTFANNTYRYNGVHRQEFETQIGEEERKENVSVNSEATFKKYAKTSIDNMNGQIQLATGNIDELEGRINTAELTLETQGARLDIVSTNIDEEGNVTALKRTNYEFGGNGIIIDDEKGYKSVKNTTGDYYYENDTMIGKYTKDGSVQKDLALFGKYYYGIDENLDVENFTKDDAMFVAQLYTDSNNEECFGHFYNGS